MFPSEFQSVHINVYRLEKILHICTRRHVYITFTIIGTKVARLFQAPPSLIYYSGISQTFTESLLCHWKVTGETHKEETLRNSRHWISISSVSTSKIVFIVCDLILCVCVCTSAHMHAHRHTCPCLQACIYIYYFFLPSHRWRKWGREMINDLPSVTQLVCNKWDENPGSLVLESMLVTSVVKLYNKIRNNLIHM